MNFNEMNLIEPLLQAVKEEGYVNPSPIQEMTIPLLLEGDDVLGCAQTGTGKTAAFALPILQNLSKTKSNKIRSLILTPTRELANQIYESFESYGKYLKLKTGVIYGGVSQNPQVTVLKNGVDILVATPGRLYDLMQQGFVKLDSVEMLVLDEADRMLDMGFLNDVKKVIKELPENRQTLLFSATMPTEIEELAKSLLKDPKVVKVDPVTSTVDLIQQSVYYVDRLNKIPLLAQIIKEKKITSAIVFTKTKHGADRVVDKLGKAKIKALAIHGGKGQTSREIALSSFKSGKIKILVATDIAARGIDISELAYVFNYDIPELPETYIHRIGRTGRAGMNGNAINFCNIDDMDNFKAIERHIGKTIPEVKSDYPMEIFEKTEKRRPNSTPKKNEVANDVVTGLPKKLSNNGKAAKVNKQWRPSNRPQAGKSEAGEGKAGSKKSGGFPYGRSKNDSAKGQSEKNGSTKNCNGKNGKSGSTKNSSSKNGSAKFGKSKPGAAKARDMKAGR